MKGKILFLICVIFIASFSCFSQGSSDWVFPVIEVGANFPIDVSSKIDESIAKSEKVFIVGYNIDMRAETAKIDLLNNITRQTNIGNFDPSRIEMIFFDYQGKRHDDVWFRFGHKIPDKNLLGLRSFYMVFTTNKDVISRIDKGDLKLVKTSFTYSDVAIYMSEAVEIQEVFFWNLRQTLLFFSNYSFVPNTIEKLEPPKEGRVKTYLDIQGYKGFEKNGAQCNYFKASTGVGFKFNKTQENIVSLNFNLGIQQSYDFWNNENFQNQVVSVLNSNHQLDEILVSSSNVKEDYTLSSTSAAIGLEIRSYLGKSKSFIGVYGNAVKPFIYDLNFTNTSGEFDYVGISNSIQEPLTNIPELGLVSGVSYVGYKSDLTGKLKTHYNFGFISGYSFGEKSPLDISLSVGLTTSKNFVIKRSNTSISSSYGDYNSLATVNTTQIAVPRFLNVGLSVRKYLN